MPRFCANLSFLFTEADFMERFAAAAQAGFRGVEFHFPYAYARDQLVDVVKRAGVDVVLFNLPAGDASKGDRGIAVQPQRKGEFQDGVGGAIEYARALGCTRINCLAGIAPAGADPDLVLTTFVDNLSFAADKLGAEGITLMMEPVNTRTVPGFYLNNTAQALDLINEVGAQNLKIQYDVFHMQIMEGDLCKTIEAELPNIGHMQVADVPDRHEPGSGEINFPFLFDWIDRIGYDGWIGAEYAPANGTLQGLGWATPYLQREGQ